MGVALEREVVGLDLALCKEGASKERMEMYYCLV
jgi:hypothetical protein